ncbi:MAG TPA: M20 family metallopeptidase [Aggregatilineales bacterium]|nr:M20 family metallopeptidase [Anaerolineales bacterium]HRE49306.1 M20 family metallopeptidase [Aggregatilineales bacterium]
MTTQTLHPVLGYYSDHVAEIVALTTTLANYETPTGSKAHVDKLADYLEELLKNDLGAAVERLPQAVVGDMLFARWNTDAPGKPILFLMHMDTVWGLGTVPARPVHVEGDRLIGPGTWDMKGSIATVLSVIKGLRERGEFPNRPVWALFTSDEETGSVHSWTTIEKIAADAGLCLVMEFAGAKGGLKTWRKGITGYTVSVKGRSSHAGNAPEKGINAVVELAHQTLRITELNRLDLGTSVSVTVVNGGTASNVIPDLATAKVDVRFLTQAEADRIESAMNSLTPVLPGAVIEITNTGSRPPMEHNETMIAVFAQAKGIGEQMGLTITEEGSGGGSDGNITSALGIPTLDGLGAMGEGAHALHEQVVISSFPRSAALLDGILREWQFA